MALSYAVEGGLEQAGGTTAVAAEADFVKDYYEADGLQEKFDGAKHFELEQDTVGAAPGDELGR